MKKLDRTTIEVIAKPYKVGKGLRFKLGVTFLKIGTYLVSARVDLYAGKTKIGELSTEDK